MGNTLQVILYILGITLLFLIISNYFFGFNPVYVIEKSIKTLTTKENTMVVDGKTLKVDNPEFPHDRFRGISYSLSYTEDETGWFVVADFIDNSGYLNNKCVRVISSTTMKDENLCSECSNKTSGRIYCNISSYKGGVLFGTFYANGGGYDWTFGSEDLKSLIDKFLAQKSNKNNSS